MIKLRECHKVIRTHGSAGRLLALATHQEARSSSENPPLDFASGGDASQLTTLATMVNIHIPVASCHSSSDDSEARLAPSAARPGGHWETLL